MADVRVPESATALLEYCKANIARHEDSFFPTYAHMVVFAASIGFHRDEFDEGTIFCKKEPYPIPMDIFRNQELYDYILILGLSRIKSFEIVEDEDALARIVEGYASAGFRHMLRLYESCGGHDYLGEWVQEIANMR